MEYKLHKDFSEINPQEWNNLLSGSITDTPFLRFEYQKAWWEYRGGGEWKNPSLVLVTAREDEKLVGIAPLFIVSHYCPAISRTESVDWRNRVNRFGSRVAEAPVEWAFSQKASRSKSVESGKG